MSHIKSINPFDNQVNAEILLHSNEELDNKLQTANEVFKTWSNTGFEYRASFFEKLSKLLITKQEELAKWITIEMGKPISEAKAEILKCTTVCDYYAKNAETILADEYFDIENQLSYVKYQPLGVILAVMPWNFPFWQVFRFAAPTLMAGNVGVLKHASNVPLCAQAIEDLFHEAGFPFGVFTNVYVAGNEVDNLIKNQIIKAVTLTGSEKAGASVASVAGANIKKSVLELGGNDAFIVLEDADLEKAVEIAAKSRLQNAGQSCIAAKRFLVQDAVYKFFKEKLIAKIEELVKLGNPLDEKVTFGPLARVDLANEVRNQIKKSVAQGAKLAYGNIEKENENALVLPVILEEIPSDSVAYNVEIFGPVFSLFKFDYIHEAIDLANDSEYGLGGSVWTSNLEMGQLIAASIETGAVFVNSFVKSDTRLPFGGVKKSGFGREMSELGIKEFVNAKTVVVVG